MSEAVVLSLVSRYPHLRGLTRRTGDVAAFCALRRLEAGGYVRRRRDGYSLTRKGRDELDLLRGLAQLVVRVPSN